jgi:hypothetical protein
VATSTLDSTVGGASANTYATLAEANQYHDDRVAVGTTWDPDASNDNKFTALLWAAQLMDSLIEWSGAVTDPNVQIMLWPRQGLVYRYGKAVPTDVIPQEIKDAQAEYARQLLVSDMAGDSDIETQGIRRLKAGPVELEFDSDVTAKNVPDAVANLIPRDWYVSITGRADAQRVLARY